MSSQEKARIELPEKLQFLFEPKRYKIMYGGRGGAKSWSIARALIVLGASKRLRILCAREIQKSIADSVHKLLADQIKAMGLDGFYQILQTTIRGANGTEFLFAGLKHNIASLKSLENCDIAWIEEAQTVSKASWDVLIPTIRKEGSEIWVSFNPELEEDETYRRFVVSPPGNALVAKITWADNPWFPEVLRQEMEDLKARDYDAYLTVWEGHCRQTLDGAIYAQEIRKATEQNRITRVPYDATKPVHTFWDLGWADNTSIWFAQPIGFEYRLIDYYENAQQALPHYLNILQSKPYVYGNDWLPHDAQAKQLGTGRSIEELMKAAGRKVKITPKLSVIDGINAARTIFGQCWFDSEKCADGLQALRHYRYEIDAITGQFSKNPLHDHASHGCLTSNAKVKTRQGDIPIWRIPLGQEVWTPSGWADVTHAGPVKEAESLVVIETCDGAILRCTPEHKVLTQKGFVCADELSYSDRIYSGKEWQCVLIRLLSTVTSSGFRAIITGETTGTSQAQVTCIGRFGNTIMAQFHRVMRCITKTKIRLTITLTTWNSSSALCTSASTPWNALHAASYILPANSRCSRRQTGTVPQKGSSGTGLTANRRGRIEHGTTANVSNVVRLLSRLILRAPNSATRIAKLRTCVNDAADKWVYDLTVRKHACYQANGLLVSNSDAFRYFAVAIKEETAPKVAKSRPPIHGARGWMA